MRPAAALLAALLLDGCAPALRAPAALPSVHGAPADAVAQAERAWAARPDPASVERALALYLQAGDAGLLGAAESAAWLVEHERSAAKREGLVAKEVQARLKRVVEDL